MVFLFMKEARKLMEILKEVTELKVTLEEKPGGGSTDFVTPAEEDEGREAESPDNLTSQTENMNASDAQEMSVTVSEDDETGEIVTQTTQTFRGSDGSSRTIKTTERYKNGETERGRSVGEAKLIKLDELQEVKDVDDDQEETDDHFIEASQSESLNANVVFQVTPTKKTKEMP